MIKSLTKRTDTLVLVIIVLFCIFLTVGSFTGKMVFFKEDYATFTLFLLSMLAVHIVRSYTVNDAFQEEAKSSLSEVENSIPENQNFQNKTIDSLDRLLAERLVLDYVEYQDSVAIEKALARAILDAENSVCDFSWKPKISEGFGAGKRKESHTYMDECIKTACKTISYREVYTFGDKRRVDKLRRRIDENTDGYSCSYFKENLEDIELNIYIPRMQYVIVDKEKIFFFAISPESPLCSFKSKELCKIFSAYFEIAWSNSITIKHGDNIDRKVLEEIYSLENLFKPC
ncbi:hypothetical protein OA7_0008760 [Vibrio cyclitrophicus 1F53]|uniref:hypothetical protein n=1 Tax=Vibrio cyclitrophicus TaxID=47951 RepID=UPI00031D29BF|nr:hypothetical protein [Vibrio cyclitrophicus]OEF34396.1 hypothetical protein OA7_08500 [Vibrio cyclitrophicus 1F53]OEF67067.1 hypothetical protein OAA_06500 [Vibrio cyclitrophicus 1F175]PMH33292.1 hypothetical protein BCU72_01660 [Vibrio cyclitrophicus]PMH79852.1 hypothetical protein BCU60_18840 [Vibrio cyclitrophicus]